MGMNLLVGSDGKVVNVGGKADFTTKPNDLFIIRTPGGGGYGPVGGGCGPGGGGHGPGGGGYGGGSGGDGPALE